MKLLYFSGCLVILTILLTGLGCSDDDCATCPTNVQKGTMKAGIWFYEKQLVLAGSILDINGLLSVDSVLVEGNAAELEWFGDESYRHIYVRYEGPRNDTRFSSGDQVDVKIYTPDGVCSSSPKILDDEVDEPEIIDWMTSWPYDTVDVDTDITVNWTSVPNADWYSFSTDYRYDSLGTHAWRRDDYYQPDTTFTIPASETKYNGYYRIVVQAWTGPYPEATDGNITGEIIKGSISSVTYTLFEIYVGTGEAWPNSELNHGVEARAPRSPREMMDDLLRARRPRTAHGL